MRVLANNNDLGRPLAGTKVIAFILHQIFVTPFLCLVALAFVSTIERVVYAQHLGMTNAIGTLVLCLLGLCVGYGVARLFLKWAQYGYWVWILATPIPLYGLYWDLIHGASISKDVALLLYADIWFLCASYSAGLWFGSRGTGRRVRQNGQNGGN